MTNPNCRVLIFSILRFISTKCCKTQNVQGTQNWIVGACMVDYRPRQLQRQKYLVAPVAEPVEATDLDSKGSGTHC